MAVRVEHKIIETLLIDISFSESNRIAYFGHLTESKRCAAFMTVYRESADERVLMLYWVLFVKSITDGIGGVLVISSY